MITGIEFISYPVQDMDRAAKFYSEVLGLKQHMRKEDKWAEFEIPGGGTLSLYDYKALGGDSFVPAMSLALQVDDMDKMVEELKARDVKFPWGGDTHDSGFCKAVAFADSEGNSVWFHHRYKPE